MEKKMYSQSFLLPAVIIFGVFFIVPTIISFFFSTTVWTFEDFKFVGLQNFKTFFSEPSMRTSVVNTLIYAVLTSGTKSVLGLFFGAILTQKLLKTKNIVRSILFFPNLVSTVAVGITFSALMHPSKGIINAFLSNFGVGRIDWLGNADIALFSLVGIDVWKGVGVATVIYIAGIQSIDRGYYEAASIDGATSWQQFKNITFPLCRPAMNSVIMLSLIGGLRTFDLIWATTKGGPGFATDTLASVVYKQYAAGYYGLSTAGNVVLFVVIALIAFPLQRFLNSKEVDM